MTKQKLLVDAGHEEGGITRNAYWDTPLMVAIKAGRTEIAVMLISRFPRCVPWKNKVGMDAVCYIHFFNYLLLCKS